MRIYDRYKEYYEDFLRCTVHKDSEVRDWEKGVVNELIVYMNNGDVISYNCMGHKCIYIVDKTRGDDELDYDEIFSRRLRGIMEARLITQRELSEKTGIAQVTINKYLNGHLNPSHSNAMKIADALGCNIKDLSYY